MAAHMKRSQEAPGKSKGAVEIYITKKLHTQQEKKVWRGGELSLSKNIILVEVVASSWDDFFRDG